MNIWQFPCPPRRGQWKLNPSSFVVVVRPGNGNTLTNIIYLPSTWILLCSWYQDWLYRDYRVLIWQITSCGSASLLSPCLAGPGCRGLCPRHVCYSVTRRHAVSRSVTPPHSRHLHIPDQRHRRCCIPDVVFTFHLSEQIPRIHLLETINKL